MVASIFETFIKQTYHLAQIARLYSLYSYNDMAYCVSSLYHVWGWVIPADPRYKLMTETQKKNSLLDLFLRLVAAFLFSMWINLWIETKYFNVSNLFWHNFILNILLVSKNDFKL